MGIRLDIDLDTDGNHTFTWRQSDDAGALDVPEALLNRWQAERDAFTEAHARWQRVMLEIENFLVDYRPTGAPAKRKPRCEQPPSRPHRQLEEC